MIETAISTEGRVFTAQICRDVIARERAGAALLWPGAGRWQEAFRELGLAISKCGGPVKAGAMFKAAQLRLLDAQRDHGACFLNCFMTRKRSGLMEVVTYSASKHPLTERGYEGVGVAVYRMSLQRNGCIIVGKPDRVAFLSWHTLGRMRERSTVDLAGANGIAAGCGLAGLLLRESAKHFETEINWSSEDSAKMICTGVLRGPTRGISQGFFDVLTALPFYDDERRRSQWNQGCQIGWMVHEYIKGDNADPTGVAAHIPVLAFHGRDYVSRGLKGNTLSSTQSGCAQPLTS
jgi:hypothetical protein